MQLTFDPDVEEFRAEFVGLPRRASASPRARRWSGRGRCRTCRSGRATGSGCCSTTAGCCPAQPPEFGGRNATVLQQFVYLEELCRRRIYHSFNPQGVNIIAASLIVVRHRRAEAAVGGADPAGRDHRVAGHERAQRGLRPGVAAHPRGASTAIDFVVNGQKVWTSGAHDADVLLTFVRTDPDAPKHKGISVLIIPTDTPGCGAPAVRRRSAAQDDLDFNEVFFTDVRVPAENLVGPLNEGWRVANGSLGHERTMMWLGFADRLDNIDRRLPSRAPRSSATSTPPRSWTTRRCACWVRWRWRAPLAARRTWPRCRCSSCSAPKPSCSACEHALDTQRDPTG